MKFLKFVASYIQLTSQPAILGWLFDFSIEKWRKDGRERKKKKKEERKALRLFITTTNGLNSFI